MKVLIAVKIFLFTLCIIPQSWASTMPTQSNTGTSGSLESVGGVYSSSYAGQVISNLSVSGFIDIRHDNVTISNCYINSNSTFCIRDLHTGATNLTVVNCELSGSSSSTIQNSFTYTIENSYVHATGGDAIKLGSNSSAIGNFITEIGTIAGKHADGIQIEAGSNISIKGNHIEMPYDDPVYLNHQCIIVQDDLGIVDNVVIEENWINGGGFSIQIRDKQTTSGLPTNCKIINNIFGPDHNYGNWKLDGNPLVSGNYDEETGQLIGGAETETEPDEERVGQPSFTPNGASSLDPITVAMESETLGASIYYTLDGSTPTTSSPQYSAPITISETSLLKAMAVKSGETDSYATESQYSIQSFTSTTDWQSLAIESQTGTFFAQYTTSSNNTESDVLTGLSFGEADEFNDVACLIRFYENGLLEVRNGDTYTADEEFAYEADKEYQITIIVDIPNSKYSVLVTDEDNPPVALATDFSFRTAQIGVETLNRLTYVGVGEYSHTITDFTITQGDYYTSIPNKPVGITTPIYTNNDSD